ncbi:MAG TPA: TetR family transcriptional regulator [Solirubrobacteraceae bacterium]|jgi:AcrR family transcriptional regulator|nr:TetR family transcriptional regulator [Solirubrobacteraceae bacterium]
MPDAPAVTTDTEKAPTASPGRIWGGLTSDERIRFRRERLLLVGLEVFGMSGWSDATVGDICRFARVSPRYFYELFDGREALFLAVCESIAEDVHELVHLTVAQEGLLPEERVRAALSALIRYFMADHRRVRVALVESCATPSFRVYRAEMLDVFASLAARLMRTLHPDPDPDPDPDSVDERRLQLNAIILSGGLAEALISFIAGRAPADPEELVDHLTALYTLAVAG